MTCAKKDRCEHGTYCQKHIGSTMTTCCFFEQKEPLTEQEYLQTCTTEQIAGIIYEWYSQGHIEGKTGKQLSSVTRVVEWLKGIHQCTDTSEDLS